MNKPEHTPVRKGGGYPKEFREEAVRYWLSSGRKASEIAPELGVSDWSLNRWRKEMENDTLASAPDSQLNALELAKENGSAQGAPGAARIRCCLASVRF
jgi:transposase-like protein